MEAAAPFDTNNLPPTFWLWRLLFRLPLMTALWWLLTDGAADSWAVGLPAIVIASAVSAALMPRLPYSARGLVRFTAFFLLESLRGGIDVARRALHRKLPLAPDLIDYTLWVRSDLARVSVSNIMCLLPGTLSVDMRENVLKVHALDATPHVQDVLELTEARVAAIFKREVRDQQATDSLASDAKQSKAEDTE